MFRPVKIRHYLSLMYERGFSPDRVLDGSDLSEDDLDHPSCLIALDQARAVISNMISLSGNQAIGLEMGQQTEIVDLGLLGHAMLSSRTVREAAQFWERYSDVLVGMLIRARFEERSPTDWSFSLAETAPLSFLYNFCVEESMVMIARLGGVLSGRKVKVERLDLSYPAPAHYREYERYFNGPIRFNARSTEIHCSHPSLDLALRSNDREFNELCARQCALIMRQIGAKSPYVSRIRAEFLRNPGVMPGLEVIACKLGMSGRTLRRHLRDEGLSFQNLVTEFRRDLAKEYLRAGDMPPKEVAYLLGFQDVNTFRRAFKAWTGKTIRQYRETSARSSSAQT
jgi:AraC-like DNA-binding protein